MEYIAESSGPGKRRRRNRKKKRKNKKWKPGCNKGRIADGTCSMDNTLDMAAYGGTLGFDPNNLKTSNFRKY